MALVISIGKSKIIDCLGFIRQVHDQRISQASHYNFNWIAQPIWAESYQIFEKILSEKLAKKDNIPLQEAEIIIKQSLLNYLAIHLQRDYEKDNPPPESKFPLRSYLKSARSVIAKLFPFSKYLYRVHVKPRRTQRREMHYEVMRIGAQYNEDFKPVIDSFSKNI